MKQIITAALAVILAVSSAAAGTENLTVGNYILVEKERVGRSVYDYTFRADITNGNTYDIRNVSAALKDKAVSTEVPDGTLSFGDVPAGGTVTSTDTFTVRVNRRFEFEASSLTWETDFSSDVPPEVAFFIHDYVDLTAGQSEGMGFTLEFTTYDTIRITQTVETDFLLLLERLCKKLILFKNYVVKLCNGQKASDMLLSERLSYFSYFYEYRKSVMLPENQ